MGIDTGACVQEGKRVPAAALLCLQTPRPASGKERAARRDMRMQCFVVKQMTAASCMEHGWIACGQSPGSAADCITIILFKGCVLYESMSKSWALTRGGLAEAGMHAIQATLTELAVEQLEQHVYCRGAV